MPDESANWWDLLQDYFGLNVENPVRWEDELRETFPNLSNDDLCGAIRSASGSCAELKRKANLSDLRGWLRSWLAREPDTMDPESCPQCTRGWLAFDNTTEDCIIVWISDGSNRAACPCTCASGRVHVDKMVQRGESSYETMRRLQDAVLYAMQDPRPDPVSEPVPEPPPCKDGPAQPVDDIVDTMKQAQNKRSAAPF